MLRTRQALVLTIFLTGAVQADDVSYQFELIVKAGKYDRKDVPVVVPLSVPKEHSTKRVVRLQQGIGADFEGQLTSPSLRTDRVDIAKDSTVRLDLHFILADLKAGKEAKFKVSLSKAAKGRIWFDTGWDDTPDHFRALYFNNNLAKMRRPVLIYMNAPYDESSAEARNRTYKAFHHLYDPTGRELVTNGGHTDKLPPDTKLLYPHHRGLYFGFNKITYDQGKKADVWHCQKDDHISHQKFLAEESGSILGRHRVLLHWHGSGKEVFAHEEREVSAIAVSGGTLIEWSTLLKTAGGPVMLNGDPQHAGFQFRAANEVAAKHEKETYFLRPDGKGKPGETRNWPDQKQHVNLPWNAMSFVIGEQRYTVAYLDHPTNPKEARHSERAYGRFGYYFTHELTKEKPLRLVYRLRLQRGEMTAEQVERLHRDFAEPPTVEVK